MLSNTDIVTKVVYPALSTLMSGFAGNVAIIEDNQDAPRPLDEFGFIKNYVFFKVLPMKQTMWPGQELVGTEIERMHGQYELTVTLNMLGTLANDINNYLVDAVASVLGDVAFKQNGVQIYYNYLTDPVDLTEIENNKWVKRVQRDLVFGYRDTNDFEMGSFTEIEGKIAIDNGITQKVVVIKPKGEENGI